MTTGVAIDGECITFPGLEWYRQNLWSDKETIEWIL